MKPLTPSEMGHRSHKIQVKKYGGKKGYRAEMKRRVMCRIAKVAGTALLIALFFQPIRISYTLAQTEPRHVDVATKDIYCVLPPELKSVCACESAGDPNAEPRQFDANGRTVMHVNNNGSIDFGACQINSGYWDKTASELRLNYKTDTCHNIEMAKHILAVQGIGAWAMATNGKCSY